MDLVPASPNRPGALIRSDVLVHKGLLSLPNLGITPEQATLEDLLFIRDALTGAGIDFLLVRGNDERPVLAIDRKLRSAVEAALSAAATSEPFYSKAVGRKAGAPVLLADGHLSAERKARVFRLYRPRVEPTGGLRFGARHGVQLELWDYRDDAVAAPVENALTRRIIPRSEFIETTTERFGFTWQTIEPMFTRVASDVTFDIDMVFSWVDGTDVEFQRARARRMQSYVVGEGDDHAARFRQLDELRYALRSVYLFAPWVRRIFIVTDSPKPTWLADHPSVTIMRSEDFFGDTSVLPTHNSQAVESQLHRIPGIAEHFIYSNDDMFFGKPVTPDMFFSPGGVSRFIEADTRIGLGSNDPRRSGFENAARVNRSLLEERFGAVITRHLEHSPAPLRKSVIEELEREFPEDFVRTASSTFRSQTDISVTNSLYHYYALLTGRAVTQKDASVKYVDTTTRAGLKLMKSLLRKRSFDMFCLNDGSFPEISNAERATAVRSFLDRYFAISAPWEHADVEADEQAV